MSQLPGYECDINTLIDKFAIQAHQQQELSFSSFKQLFRDGCYAYIHQAYWGCEHSPEYAQLLFAVALDRLDIPSPTAPAESCLWQLHQLKPQGDNPGPGGASMQTDPTEQHLAATAGGAEAMDVDQLQLLSGPDSFAPPAGQPGSPSGQPAAMQLDGHLVQQQDRLQQQQQQQQLQAGQLDASAQDQLSSQQQQQQHEQEPLQQLPSTEELCQHSSSPQPAQQGPPQWQQDQVQQHQQDVAQQQQQQQRDVAQQQQQDVAQQQQQQQQQTQQQLLAQELLSSPLLLPHQTPPQLGQSGMPLSPGSDLWQLMPTPLQQQQGTGDAGQSDLGCLEGFMLPGPAIPPASHPQQPPQQPPLEQQAMQAPPPQMQPPPGVGTSADGVQLPLLPQQQQQQQQGWRMQAEEEDEFLSDLLAIFDEAMQGQEQHQHASPAPIAGAAASHGAAPNWGDAAAGPASPPEGPQPQQPQQQQPQPQPILQIPLVVKGAAVFTLLALHESQLNYPKAPVYVPLPLLQQLVAAAGEFRAAGVAAADALQALQLLVQQQRLLVGQFRRPNNWEPQLPPYLMPGGRLPGGLGLNTAIGVVARKAARAAARSSMQYAAVAAAARAARGAAGFDPGVQREAMFHIKSALRTLSNFRSLQSLCDEYAGTRNAIFEPLLGTTIPHPVPAPEQQQPPATAPQPQQQAGTGKRSKQGGMVVMRGGSRRKRKAALAAAAAVPAAKPGGLSQDSPAAAAASAVAGAGAASREQAAAPAAVAASAPAAAGVDLPELFDTAFAASLQGLANSEAARMLLLLDPYYNANQVRKRTKEEKRAAKAAEEAAAAAAKGRLSRFQRLTMKRAGPGGQDRQQGQQPSRSAPAALAGVQGIRQELLAAGVFSEQDLQDASASLADLGGEMRGGAQQALRRAAQQRQTAVQVAQEWLRAQSALVVVDADEDEDGGDGGEDMP